MSIEHDPTCETCDTCGHKCSTVQEGDALEVELRYKRYINRPHYKGCTVDLVTDFRLCESCIAKYISPLIVALDIQHQIERG